MKNLQLSDLIPTKTLFVIAQRITGKAYEIARSKNVPIRSPGEILIEPPKITQTQTIITIKLSNPRIAAYEWGSGIHKKRGTPGKYIITPDTKRALWFPYPEGKIYPGAKKYK